MAGGCEPESTTQHFRGRWHGFGTVQDHENLFYAIFESTETANGRLCADSFRNKNLIRSIESIGRSSFVTRAVFDDRISSPTKGKATGISVTVGSSLRALKADIPPGDPAAAKVRSICVLDRVQGGDFEGHATLGYSELINGNLSDKQLGKVRATIRMDLANAFSEARSPAQHDWPRSMEVMMRRLRSIARVLLRPQSRT